MNDAAVLPPPRVLAAIEDATARIGFGMASERTTGSILRALAGDKPGGAFLELGTGTGLSAAWLLDGMDQASSLVTIDNDPAVVAIAREHLGRDRRVSFHVGDGAVCIRSLQGQTFDFIFADTWPGKYTDLEETLALLKPGGMYVIDDMLPQPNWTPDHLPKVSALIETLEQRRNLKVTKLNAATGIIIATKTA